MEVPLRPGKPAPTFKLAVVGGKLLVTAEEDIIEVSPGLVCSMDAQGETIVVTTHDLRKICVSLSVECTQL
jgi:hypothetical protein